MTVFRFTNENAHPPRDDFFSTDLTSGWVILSALNSFYSGDKIAMSDEARTFEGEADTQEAHDWIRVLK